MIEVESEVGLFRTEERAIPIRTAGDLVIDGVVSVRRAGFRLGPAQVGFERHEPVAVVMVRSGGRQRVALPREAGAPGWLVWVATPLLAGMVTRALRGRRKKVR